MVYGVLALILDTRPLLSESFDAGNMDRIPLNCDNEGIELFGPPGCQDLLGLGETLELAEMKLPDVALFMRVFDTSAVGDHRGMAIIVGVDSMVGSIGTDVSLDLVRYTPSQYSLVRSETDGRTGEYPGSICGVRHIRQGSCNLFKVSVSGSSVIQV